MEKESASGASGSFYSVSGTRYGPVDGAELLRLFVEGHISADTQVLLSEQSGWQTLDESGLIYANEKMLPSLTARQRREISFFSPVFRMLDYEGRSAPSECARFIAIAVGGSLIVFLAANLVFDSNPSSALFISAVLTGLLWLVFLCAVGFPLIIRRLHDFGYSAWWVLAIALVSMIPVIGVLVQLYVYFVPASEPGTNQYGPNPNSSYPAYRIAGRL